MTGTINFYGSSHKREKLSNPKLAWKMFYNIYHMYSDINDKEETNEALLLTSMSDHKDMNKFRKITLNLYDNHQE